MSEKKNILLLRGLTREKAHWYDFPEKLQAENDEYRIFHLELPGAGKYSNVEFPLKTKPLVKFLNSQIVRGLKNIKKNNNVIFAYEPVWSIGTGIIPKVDKLKKQIFDIKKIIKNFWKLDNPNIIYGGSVNSKNINELKKITSIKGFLIGGASQNSKNFIDIIKKTIN